MKKIRPLKIGEDVLVARNEIARHALAEVEQTGDAVRVILRLAEALQEERKRKQ